jgi:hypothetical protein
MLQEMAKYILNIAIWTLSLLSTGYSNSIKEKSFVNSDIAIYSLKMNWKVGKRFPCCFTNNRSDLLKIYSIAISQYIKAIYEKDKIKLDTLFFNKRKNGQPDDFPDIELPQSINGTRILLLTPDEAKSKQQFFKRSTPFINLIGFENEDKVEFIFITFYPDFQHRYDCYINYLYNSKTGEFDSGTTRIEVLIYDKKGNADHYSVYENGKYIPDKPLN